MACGSCGGNRAARKPQIPSGMTIGYLTVTNNRVTGQFTSWLEAVKSGKGEPKVVNMINGTPSEGALRSLGVEP